MRFALSFAVVAAIGWFAFGEQLRQPSRSFVESVVIGTPGRGLFLCPHPTSVRGPDVPCVVRKRGIHLVHDIDGAATIRFQLLLLSRRPHGLLMSVAVHQVVVDAWSFDERNAFRPWSACALQYVAGDAYANGPRGFHGHVLLYNAMCVMKNGMTDPEFRQHPNAGDRATVTSTSI